MLLRIKGTPINVTKPLVGRVTRYPEKLDAKTFLLIDDGVLGKNYSFNCMGILTTQQDFPQQQGLSAVIKIPTLKYLKEKDIVLVNVNGVVNTLYRNNSLHNTLLVTERCNSNCLMCSQPPKDRDDTSVRYRIHEQLIPLIPKDCVQLGVSGGEPTLAGELFFKLLELLKLELPNTEIHVLTNGRAFAWNDMAKRTAELATQKMSLGIPLYADYYQIHDYIVQAQNAFYQTILGLHNLARYDQRIELRIVLHKQSIPRLSKLAKFIYKNLPFVEHVAFMGLEYIGYTPYNIEKLWIDPYDYQEQLYDAVSFLAGQGMYVSIYNTPLCVLPKDLWLFARKSISDWKNDYLPECESCEERGRCGGFFTWNLKKHSRYIKPFSS